MILVAVGFLFLSACKPTVPKEYIQPDDMEDLLYDYYVAKGMPSDPNSKETDYDHRYKINLVLKKYGLTQAELDSSLKYYYTNMEDLYKIYGNVQKRLSETALELGASSNEVERFTTQSLSGDTTEVWEGSRQMVLFPKPPYHIFRFSQKADSSYHQGDSFLMTFGNSFLVQSGSKNATVVLSVKYENDSIISHYTNISQMGTTTLRIPACNLKAKELTGYVYMPKRQGVDNENDMCVLLLNHIQLVRFHHKTSEEKHVGPVVNAADTLKNDSLKNDSLKPRRHRLGERPMPTQSDNKQLIKPITK
jgi:hypothetical protein